MIRNRISRYKNKLRLKKTFPQGSNVVISDDFRFGKYCQVLIRESNVTIRIEQNVYMREFCNMIIEPGATLKIGKNVFFNNYCSINCLDNISIGENTLFGEGVKLYDHNHKYQYTDNRLEVSPHDFTKAPITIGSNCWIASNVTILKGVTIGNNVIIGANNLIYKSIPDNAIVKSNQTYSY